MKWATSSDNSFVVISPSLKATILLAKSANADADGSTPFFSANFVM